MKKLILNVACLGFGLLFIGCGGTDSSNQPGAVNTGAGGGDGGQVEDPDAGVGTDPALMDPNHGAQ